jgi:hypothetical protein
MNTLSPRRNATLMLLSLLSAVFALALLVSPHGAAAATGRLIGPRATNTIALSPTNKTVSVQPGEVYRYEYVIANASAQPQKVQFTAKSDSNWSIAGDSQQILVPAFSKVPVKIAVKAPANFTTALGSAQVTITAASLTSLATEAATSYLTLQWGK